MGFRRLSCHRVPIATFTGVELVLVIRVCALCMSTSLWRYWQLHWKTLPDGHGRVIVFFCFRVESSLMVAYRSLHDSWWLFLLVSCICNPHEMFTTSCIVTIIAAIVIASIGARTYARKKTILWPFNMNLPMCEVGRVYPLQPGCPFDFPTSWSTWYVHLWYPWLCGGSF